MLLFNLKIAFRNVFKNKVFSAVNIIGLALSMACCLLVFLFIHNELSYDSFHKNLPHIYRVTEKQVQAGDRYNVAVTPGPLAPALQKDFAEIDNTVRIGNWSGVLKVFGSAYEEKNILLTENSFFSVFSFPVLKGNPATILSAPDNIAITERAAEKYFGKDWRSNPAILGQTIRMNNETDFRLSAILQNPPDNSSIQFDILLPLAWYFKTDEWSYKWNSNNYHTYLQIKPGFPAAAFEKKICRQLNVYSTKTDDQLQLQPLEAQYLYSAFDFKTDWGKRSSIRYIKIFSGVGLLLLIIACVNFINLSTARAMRRAMEVGIKKVHGASRRQLVFQFISESLLLSSIAGALCIIIIVSARPFLEALTGSAINTSLFHSPLVPVLLVFVLIIGLMAGLYPAFALSAFSPASVLKKTGYRYSGKLVRQGLVVFQFVIAIILITATFFMYRQLHFMQEKDLGFDKEQLVNVRLGGGLKFKSALFKHELYTIAGVTAAAPATMSLVNVDNSSYIEWEGMREEDKFLTTQTNADPDFIPTLGMQLLAGNNFNLQPTGNTNSSFIVNEAVAKRMGLTLKEILGKEISFYGAKGKIIGIVKDFNFKPLTKSIEPFLMRYQPANPYFNIFVKIAPGKTQDVLLALQKLYKNYETDTPLEYSFVNESLDAVYRDDKRTAAIILLFSNFTIFVGCLGLFGLAVFSAEQRTKEIGIRKVLGASLGAITGLLSGDFIKLVILAIIISIPATWLIVTKWLQQYAYRISIDWWVFAIVALAVICLALFTISFQALKAATANPVNSLRTE